MVCMQPGEGKMMEWRCANGTVLACLYGANIPCGSKAKTSRKPTPAIVDYCRQNPDSDFVPMVVTGHESAVSWACHRSVPVAVRSAAVDAQGFTAFTISPRPSALLFLSSTCLTYPERRVFDGVPCVIAFWTRADEQHPLLIHVATITKEGILPK
jgi:hypothetical protein